MALFNESQRDGLAGFAFGVGALLIGPIILAGTSDYSRRVLKGAISKYLGLSENLRDVVGEASKNNGYEKKKDLGPMRE